MFGIENYTGFIIAGVLLNLAPGVDTFYILSRSAAFGRKAGVTAVAGIISGCLIHVLCSAFGLSLVLTNSVLIFSMIKWAGALYLIYIGVRTLFQKTPVFAQDTKLQGQEAQFPLQKIYKQGILTNLLNPKISLFFLSFLPQFINPEAASGPIPFLILGGTFLFTGTLWCLCLAWGGSFFTGKLKESKSAGVIFQKISGLIFIAFGLKLGLDNS